MGFIAKTVTPWSPSRFWIAMRKKYDWQEIQKFYDDLHSWRDVMRHFGVANRAVQKAVLRGDLVLRDATSARKLKIAKYGNSKMGAEARKKLSIEQSAKNRGGKSKWYEVSGQKLQGTWERDLAVKFNEIGIKWKKLSVGKEAWPYLADGRLKHYTPDFYLPDLDVYLDPKGYWWGRDKEKIKTVKQQYGDRKLIIIEKDLFRQILKSSRSEIELILRAAS